VNYVLGLVGEKMSVATMLGAILLFGSFIFSAVISYLCSDQERRSWHGFWRHFLPLEILRHQSAHADIRYYISGKLISLGAPLSNAAVVVGVGVMVNRLFQYVLPWPPASTAGSTGMLVLFTLTMLLMNDFARYLSHYLQHRVPILWELHKAHHSAEAMVVVTRYRVHPIETFIAGCGEGLFEGIVYGVWLFYAYDPVEIAVFGINIRRFRDIITLDYIRHAPYKISYGPIFSKVLLSPHYHHLHHSALPEHWNKNFGFGLSCWDWLFGTLMAPKPNEDFIFGLRLTDQESEEYHTWWRLYTVPLVKIGSLIKDWMTSTAVQGQRSLLREGSSPPPSLTTMADSHR
jgi:sterol desaturase/sphingolipid hydroxylase (fatty acid hydroxylase superfamily)